ncbi:class I SAM-dependent methyltransferase [Bythopirellula goksoeyrii]|uniref:Uncharacterized protein n=1 Tax=Bythopirellula goksoeyrii TaxID=1400387 RepID=A0A5B9QBD5_9BACT|nr:class I SAM-dependent methyltransferase [Bythopirellula goksoeyrii]QEG34822.1 hypothetical protein Pr1d_21070 [Bythopirellula goksoeyrii]
MSSSPDSPLTDSSLSECCRFCEKNLEHTVVDLGLSPLCQNIVTLEQAGQPEVFYPLQVRVCEACWLVQVHAHVMGEDIFQSDYAYFSSYSDSWLKHCREYVELMTDRLQLGPQSQVVEVASNDGYLLQYFVQKGIPALGVEPAVTVAEAARAKGVHSINEFFGAATAQKLVEQNIRPDLLLGNNVLAHVPDLNDFVTGLKILLKNDGVITFEFPHLMCLIEGNQFDTIYQEHYCYFSLLAIQKIFLHHGLTIFDVNQLMTHGGSLRIYARHSEDSGKPVLKSVQTLIDQEIEKGYNTLATYSAFAQRVVETKWKLLEFLMQAKRAGKTVVGYGAPGKGNTLLNYCGIRSDSILYTVDRNPVKQNTLLPGSRIPVYTPERIAETRPDYVLILPWNLREEIMEQLSYIRQWGGKFVVPIPETQIFD